MEISHQQNIESFEIKKREGFGLVARGYAVEFTDHSLEPQKIADEITNWAIKVGIEFGGGIFRGKDGALLVEGAFPPNKFDHTTYTHNHLSFLIESLREHLEVSGLTTKRVGSLQYDLQPRQVESLVGLTAGYSNDTDPANKEHALNAINNVIDVKDATETLIFYNYGFGKSAGVGKEPGLRICGELREGQTDQSAAHTIMHALDQTSLHMMVGEGSGVTHEAFQQVKKKTAREQVQTTGASEEHISLPASVDNHPKVPFCSKEALMHFIGDDLLSDKVNSAFAYAEQGYAHCAKRTGGGDTLTEHIYPVVQQAVYFGRALNYTSEQIESLIITALLHDYIEDVLLDPKVLEKVPETGLKSEEGIEKVFGNALYKSISFLTRREKISDQDYYKEIASDPFLSLIKIADRINNHSCDHLLSYRSRENYRFDTVIHLLPIARELGAPIIDALEKVLMPPVKEPRFYTPHNPYLAALVCGGATFAPHSEAHSGFSVYTGVPREGDLNGTLESVIETKRSAVYVPTIPEHGGHVSPDVVESIMNECRALGLDTVDSAFGVREFREGDNKGNFGLEPIWVCSSPNTIPEPILRALSMRIQRLCQQEGVAYEFGHQLSIIPFDGIQLNESKHDFVPYDFPVRAQTTKKALVVIPINDAEAVVARDYAKQIGATVITTEQQWGASWEQIPEDIRNEILTWRIENPDGEILGFELKGKPIAGGSNIDNVTYSDEDLKQEDAKNGSSLMELSKRLDVPLTNWEMLIASNRAGDPSALRSGLSSIGIDPDSQMGHNCIRMIRYMNRACQGITPSEEATARLEVEEAIGSDDRKIVVYSTRLWTAHADELFEKGISEQLHIPADNNGRTVYYGRRVDELKALFDKNGWDGYWMNTSSETSGGYFGVVKTTPEIAAAMSDLFLN